jgi:acyl carrier protein
MEKSYTNCLKIVINVIVDYAKEVNIIFEKLDETTRLIGSTSEFDSSDLVQIIVEIEDKINQEFNTDITLTDEKAMSRTTSPFVNIGTLVNFIVDNLK